MTRICNNSSKLSFEVTIKASDVSENKSITLNPLQRLDFSALFDNSNRPNPSLRKYDIVVNHNGKFVGKNERLPEGFYLALLGPEPHVHISIDPSDYKRMFQEAMDLCDKTILCEEAKL